MIPAPWTPPADIGSDEPGPHARDVGAFRLLAWQDGHWAIAFAEDGEWVVDCLAKAEDLAQAQRTVEARLRAMVLVTAEALGLLRAEVTRG